MTSSECYFGSSNAGSRPVRESQRVVLLLMLIQVTGCSSQERSAAPPAANQIEQAVIDEVALVVRFNADDIAPTTSFGELGIDDLDLVEIVMALEDRFKVSIPDSSLNPSIVAGDKPPIVLNENATIRDLAAILPPLLTQQAEASGNGNGNHEQ